MADKGFVNNAIKMFKGNDSAKSPTRSKPETPTSTKDQLNAETDKGNGFVFDFELLQLLGGHSKSQELATQHLLAKHDEKYKLLWVLVSVYYFECRIAFLLEEATGGE